ncbi:MAG: efflux RND transporter permease subunit [Proteobacteria bacterium]|nr:efflux RND transporter permease subunit [Pseudomonadota bacterium]
MSLINAAVARARTTIAVLLLLLITGMSSYINIPKEAEPDINIPIIYVNMTHEGISPEDAERLLVRPMEKELKSIEGVKEMRSTAVEGSASVLLEFEAGFNSQKALDDVREKVDTAKPELPAETDEPIVQEVNLSLFPVLVVTLGGDLPERTLLKLGRDLRDKIEGLPSVLEVKIGGDRDELVEILVDPMQVESYALNVRQIDENIKRSNQLVAAGTLDTGSGRFAIKVPGLFENVNDILDMPLKTKGDAVVRIRDIASIRRSFKDRRSFARVNGRPAISLDISKRTGENIIDTIARVRTLVKEEAATWPPGVEVNFSQDKSQGIRDMLRDLQNNVTSAVLLVMIIIVAALGIRSGLLVGVAIPGSFLTGILVLSLMGFTVNIVVLFGLILSVGMLVDGAIVVVEYADRKMREGDSRRDAYIAAAKRMAWPIIASTATTLAAFLPLLFWPGIVGEFMKYLPITLIATLSASLLMALIFVPTLGVFFGKASDGGAMLPETADPYEYQGVTGLYVRLLGRLLNHPGKVLASSFCVLVGAWMLYVNFGKGVEFFPKVEPEQAVLQIHARGNISVHEKDRLVAEVEQRIVDLQRERGEFKSIITISGEQERRDDTLEDVIGTIRLEFVFWEKRRRADDILLDVLVRTKSLAGIAVETRKQEGGPPIGKPIHIQLTSRQPKLIAPAVDKIRDHLETMSGLKDIEDSRPISGIEWEINVDRAQAAKFGADIASIGAAVQMITKGLKFSDFRPDNADEEIDIVARYPIEWRSMEQLDQIRIQTDVGLIPISNFVKRTARPKTGELRRTDGKRSMTVKADVLPGVLADNKVHEIQAWLTSAKIDPNVTIKFKGEDEEQRKAEAFLTSAFGIALFMMAVILVTQFNSFYSTFLILSAVIMSTVGVMLGLLAIGEPFSIVMSGIGVIALAGIVVNNNIVLIDAYDRIRAVVPDAKKAILISGAQRMRPVLLTAITTILGVLPMVLQINIDFIDRAVNIGAPSTQWWRQISAAIAFGLAFATVLTLIVTPSALMARANIAAWKTRRRDKMAIA